MMKIETLKKRPQFTKIAKIGSKWVCHGMILQINPNNLGIGKHRFGFTVTKKIGGAVTRNRIKRRLRAVVREKFSIISENEGLDIVLIGRKNTKDREYKKLLDDFIYCLQKLKIIRK